MTDQKNIIIAAGAAIFSPEKKLFIMQSAGKAGSAWLIPGGKVAFGETVEAAVHREICEETGLILDNLIFLGYRDFDSGEKRYIYFDFIAEAQNPDNVVLNREAKDYAWVQVEDISRYELSRSVDDFFAKYIERLRTMLVAGNNKS